MNFKFPILLAIAILPALACSRLGFFPTPTSLPLPADLATTPLPDGSQPGKLEATCP
jgi:hypothetical protein